VIRRDANSNSLPLDTNVVIDLDPFVAFVLFIPFIALDPLVATELFVFLDLAAALSPSDAVELNIAHRIIKERSE